MSSIWSRWNAKSCRETNQEEGSTELRLGAANWSDELSELFWKESASRTIRLRVKENQGPILVATAKATKMVDVFIRVRWSAASAERRVKVSGVRCLRFTERAVMSALVLSTTIRSFQKLHQSRRCALTDSKFDSATENKGTYQAV